MRYFYRPVIVLVLCLGLFIACEPKSDTIDEPSIVVYSARKEHLIKPVFDRFTQLTGIPIRYITDEAGPLLVRLQAEGENTPADMLMTVDAGNLWQAAQAGLLQTVHSPILKQNVPDHLRDPDDRWFALTVRARTLVYNTKRVQPSELVSYENLAEPFWQGRLCLRTSKKVYNQSLVATMIAAIDEEATQRVVEGWVNNLALAPFSNDTLVMEAIAVGQCDVGIVNSYYFGRLKRDQPALPLALFWPNQQGEGAAGRGAHINVSGAGLTRYAKHPEQAKQLLEWLSQPEAQTLLMTLNLEYPVNPIVEQSAELASFGSFNTDSVNVSEAGRLQKQAVQLMDRAGYR